LVEFRRWGVGESMDEMIDDGGKWWFKKSMKCTLFALFTALVMVGCRDSPSDSTTSTQSSKPIDFDDPETLDKIIAEAIDQDKLKVQGKKGEELYYAPNQQTPYTGGVKEIYSNGQIKLLGQVKCGKADGLLTLWHGNGKKMSELNLNDGKENGLWTVWYEKGQKQSERKMKDGKLDGLLTKWHENGQKKYEGNYKDGKPNGLEIEWYKNGQKKNEANYKDNKHDGLHTQWNEKGQIIKKITYKDGFEVKD